MSKDNKNQQNNEQEKELKGWAKFVANGDKERERFRSLSPQEKRNERIAGWATVAAVLIGLQIVGGCINDSSNLQAELDAKKAELEANMQKELDAEKAEIEARYASLTSSPESSVKPSTDLEQSDESTDTATSDLQTTPAEEYKKV